ncbi:MAG: hypothetical protein Q9211_001249 [Gyalolechia sp. 1 TL-2023]
MACSMPSGSDGSPLLSSTDETTVPSSPESLSRQLPPGGSTRRNSFLNVYTFYATIYFQTQKFCHALQATPDTPPEESTVTTFMTGLAKLKQELWHRAYVQCCGKSPYLDSLREVIALVDSALEDRRHINREAPDNEHDVSQHHGRGFRCLRLLDRELCIFKTNAKEYYLETGSADAADVEEPEQLDIRFRLGRLFYIVWYPDVDPNHEGCYAVSDDEYNHVRPYPDLPDNSPLRAQPFEMLPLAKDRAPVKCIFAYLGWLAERRIQPPKKRQVTYFQILLNLSTDPVSVWVMYTYHIYDYPYQWTNSIASYKNRLYNNARVDHKRKNPNPFCTYKSISPPADYKDFRKTYTNVEENPFPGRNETGNEGTIPATEGVDGTDMNENCDAPATHGYFGLRRPFDLALLAPDISTWTADGFDPREIKECLYSSNIRLGASLQKESVDLRKKWGDILSDRVDIRGLRFRQTPSPVQD